MPSTAARPNPARSTGNGVHGGVKAARCALSCNARRPQSRDCATTAPNTPTQDRNKWPQRQLKRITLLFRFEGCVNNAPLHCPEGSTCSMRGPHKQGKAGKARGACARDMTSSGDDAGRAWSGWPPPNTSGCLSSSWPKGAHRWPCLCLCGPDVGKQKHRLGVRLR